MASWVCYYHIIWATKHRTPLISNPIEEVIFATIRRKSQILECPLLAINGIADHIHVAVSITPKLAVAEWVRHAKGLSTREINASFQNLEMPFRWQEGYHVLTYGKKNLDFVLDYIANQKTHHSQNTLEPYLEQLDNE